MPHANNQGVRIHFQVVGKGPPLVVQHGFNGSIMDWYDFGYVERLHNSHRLILVDARGHGASDKLHEPEDYSLDKLVSDTTAVLDDLQIKKANYLGYSMGGWIGFGMAKYAKQRLKSVIIGGAQPYGRSFVNARKILSKGLDAWMAIVEDWGIYSPGALARLRENDAKALRAAIQDRPDMSNVLPGVTMPCLLYAGDEDDQHDLMERCAQELANATFLSLPGLDHFSMIPRSDLLAPHIMHFLAAVG